MLYALDKAGTLITAARAAARRAHGYVCPCCGKPVSVRAGQRYSPYFAHRAHVASPDCENFHPGTPSAGDTQRQVSARPLALYVVLENPYGRRSPWRIELLIPKSPDGSGTVLVPAGTSGTISISCTQLNDAGRRIPVRPLREPYQLRTANVLDAEYTRQVSVLTPGLDTDIANVFRFTYGGGRRLMPQAPLYWGRGYYLVSGRSLQLNWPDVLWQEDVGDSGGWRCSRIELPREPDEGVIQWSAALLGREVVQAPVTLSLVSPASARYLDDDSIQVSPDVDVLIGLVTEHGAAMPDDIYLTTTEGMECLSLASSDKNRTEVTASLGRLPVGRAKISIAGDDDVSLALDVRPQSPGKAPLGPQLRFAENLTFSSVPSFSVAAEFSLEMSRLGRKELTDLNIQPRVTIRLRTRRDGRSSWKEDIFGWDSDDSADDPAAVAREFERGALAAITRAVRSHDELEIDLGNFGRLHLASKPAPPTWRRSLTFTGPLRERIRWLSSLRRAAGQAGPLTSVPELHAAVTRCLNLSSTIENLDDRRLLADVAAHAQWPTEVLPQLRELATQLTFLANSES